ncbi:hypothetical protein RvY_16747 [Ramazzottius varieornatus]|uniref:Uncharacterized protein n=1 Tax=Ramazzottius varieornatus TaxID=947166 RepID=A0A1D1W0P5_RAMVA|nr:hypothetical protein RvY_16747 [Ramazzottius varieornatus]
MILLVELTVEEVVAAVKSFPNGSAGGVDGLRPQRLKDMLAGPSNGATAALSEALAKQERQANQEAAAEACPGILFPSRSDLSLLGAPLLEEAVRAKTSKIKLVHSNLNLLFAHQALFLLKNCLCLPKLLYILRCSPVWKAPWVLQEFNEVVRTSLAEITNVEMTSGPRRQATLPVSLGGLGIRRTEEIALPAFLASIHSVRQLVPTSFLELTWTVK